MFLKVEATYTAEQIIDLNTDNIKNIEKISVFDKEIEVFLKDQIDPITFPIEIEPDPVSATYVQLKEFQPLSEGADPHED